MRKRLRLQIFGRVQAVGYRYHTQKKSLELDLVGYVKNLPNNTVTLVAEGEEKNLFKLIKWCQDGPAAAKVDKVQEFWENATNEFTDFKIITT